jgi:hypothetical protein
MLCTLLLNQPRPDNAMWARVVGWLFWLEIMRTKFARAIALTTVFASYLTGEHIRKDNNFLHLVVVLEHAIITIPV